MAVLKILFIIYLCSFVCSWAGFYLVSKEVTKRLRKEEYHHTYINTIPACWVFLIPILNTLIALKILSNYDHIVKKSVEDIKEKQK